MTPTLEAELETEVKSKVVAFTNDLTEMIMSAVAADISTDVVDRLHKLAEAVKTQSGSIAPKAKAIMKLKATGVPKVKRGRKPKANPAVVKAMADRVLVYIKLNPNLGKGAIAKALGVESADLRVPMLQLLNGAQIKSQGVKRGATYAAV